MTNLDKSTAEYRKRKQRSIARIRERKNEMARNGIVYKPRNEFCVIRIEDRGQSEGGVLVPQASFEGKEFFVEAVGPKVVDLEVGDQVLVVGTKGQDIMFLPARTDAFVTKEQNVLMRFEKVQESGDTEE